MTQLYRMADDATASRFWARVDVVSDGDACWRWKAGADADGYGMIKVDGRSRRVHRIAWELGNGPIPAGLFVCHRCDTPACVRVDHLFLGTPKDNANDRDRKGRNNVASGDEHYSRRRPDLVRRGPRGSTPRTRRGASVPSAKLSDEEVRSIRAAAAAGVRQAALARSHRVSKATISFIVHRLRWSHVQ
jgi:hypothetical protein